MFVLVTITFSTITSRLLKQGECVKDEEKFHYNINGIDKKSSLKITLTKSNGAYFMHQKTKGGEKVKSNVKNST